MELKLVWEQENCAGKHRKCGVLMICFRWLSLLLRRILDF